MRIRVVSDVHGRIPEYVSLVQDCPLSLQLGDLGFDYTSLSLLDPDKHKVVGGNHDNYDGLTSHFLGDFGVWNGLFYIRGAESIDKATRTPGFDWWPDEQLGLYKLHEALDYYKYKKPNIVVTHECPSEVQRMVLQGKQISYNSTAALLQQCLMEHQPKLWLFGHYHQNWIGQCMGTIFQCLAPLQYLDLEVLST